MYTSKQILVSMYEERVKEERKRKLRVQPDRACRKKKSAVSPKYNIQRKEQREEQPVRCCRTKKTAVRPAHRIPRKQPII